MNMTSWVLETLEGFYQNYNTHTFRGGSVSNHVPSREHEDHCHVFIDNQAAQKQYLVQLLII
jgi:hypothetical protein